MGPKLAVPRESLGLEARLQAHSSLSLVPRAFSWDLQGECSAQWLWPAIHVPHSGRSAC